MSSNIKNIAKQRWLSADLDMDEAGDDVRAALLMTNTTGDTDIDADHVGDLGTLDDCDGANYVRKSLANQAVAVDDTNDRASFDADDLVYTSLGNGTRQIQGVLIYEFITNDAGSFMIAWVEFSSTINPGGSTLTVVWNASGIILIT